MKQGKNENALVRQIERTFGPAKARALVVRPGDDAALWSPSPDKATVLTCDWFLEDTHFLLSKHRPDAIGWKCLARAVSDIAAMGGKPRCFLLSLALPGKLTGKWLRSFLLGLRRASGRLGCELAGGDTTRQEQVLISITVIGEIHRRRAILRSGARPGDLVFVSGTLGEAQVGWRELRQKRGMPRATDAALKKHLYPQPRLELGRWLAESRLATAMMDISDGLSTDLPRLCSSSRVGALINADFLPVSSLASPEEAQELAVHGGDDYELLFTVKAKNAGRMPQNLHGLPLTCVGKIIREGKILLKTREGKTKPLRPGGWDPFRNHKDRITE